MLKETLVNIYDNVNGDWMNGWDNEQSVMALVNISTFYYINIHILEVDVMILLYTYNNGCHPIV